MLLDFKPVRFVRIGRILLRNYKTKYNMNKEYVLDKIRELMPDDSKRPMGVGYVELKNAVQADLKKIMNELLKDGEINYFKTLNGVTIYLKNSKI